MKEGIIIEDTHVLTPNAEHKNFTATDEIIPAGTKVCGSKKIIKGKRRGEDFDYKIFVTDKNQFIYLNKIKPMQTTEVTMGADASKQTTAESKTVVSIPNKGHLNKTEIISTLVGGAILFAYCKHKKHDTKKMMIYTGAGLLAGFLVGRFALDRILHTRQGVVVKPAK